MVKIIEKDGVVKEVDEREEFALNTLRHTTSHVLAQAVKRLYKNAKLGTGPYVENGFYYDIDFGDESISDTDLEKIEKEMQKIVQEKFEVERYTMKRDEAIKFFEDRGENFKVELINDLPADTSAYFAKQGEFDEFDLNIFFSAEGEEKNAKFKYEEYVQENTCISCYGR